MEGMVLRALWQVLLVIAGLAMLSSPALGGWLAPCATAHLIVSWKHDGLWLTSAVDDPPLSVDGHDVSYVGKLHAGGRAYKIYYDQNTEPGSEAHDAAHDIIVTTRAGKFLGLYNVSDVSDIADPIGIEGSDVLFRTEKNERGRFLSGRLHFGPQGPPRKTNLVLGYALSFQTPADWRSILSKEPKLKPGPNLAKYCRR